MAQSVALTEREQEIVDFWKNEGKHYLIPGSIILVLTGIIIGGFIFGAEQPFFTDNDNFLGYSTNIFTELLSAGITILVLDRLNQRRAINYLKNRLPILAKSLNNGVAVEAANEMWFSGWLDGENGLLKGADLRIADLQGAYLMGAELSNTIFWKTNLKQVNLSRANFEGANLVGANLEGAILRETNLKGAQLMGTNFEGAILRGVNLKGAQLMGANLRLVKWREPDFSDLDMTLVDLQHTHLSEANFEGAILRNANLQNATFREVNFRKIDLSGARCKRVTLRGDLTESNLANIHAYKANFEYSNLRFCDLSQSYLGGSSLKEANLQGTVFRHRTNLKGASLKAANLTGAIFAHDTFRDEVAAEFDENTILPDGTKYDPTQGIEQLTRFGAIVEPLTSDEIRERQKQLRDEQGD